MNELDFLNRWILDQVRSGNLGKEIAFQCLKLLKEHKDEESVDELVKEISYQFPSLSQIRQVWNDRHQQGAEDCAYAQPSTAMKSFFFEMIPNGLMSSNCYVIGQNGEGAVIDPGCRFEKVKEVVGRSKLRIKYILLTHAHIDHMLCMEELKDMTGAEIVLHELDAEGIRDMAFNGSIFVTEGRVFKGVDKFVQEGDILEVGGLQFEVFHTPGHTRGSICYKMGNLLFPGDTFFKGALGKIGFVSGDEVELYRSFERLIRLDESCIVYPGHGKPTTIGEEKLRRM